MILSPAILALLCSSLLVSGIGLLASIVGVSSAVGWDPHDYGARQLARERRMFLVEAILKVDICAQVASLFLFIATIDRLHPLLTGAMCAAGTLNASSYGYPTLFVKLGGFVLCGLWLVVNHASPAASGTTLVRFKVLFLLVLVGALLAENVLQYRYFASLHPDIITSCCATIFRESAEGLGSRLAAIPVGASRLSFFLVLALTLVAGLRALASGRAVMLFATLTPLLGIVSLSAISVWVAPGFYELPTHHCPFCLLSSGFGTFGYPLYAALGVGVVAGVGSGLVRGLRRIDTLQCLRPAEERKLCLVAMAGFSLFTLIAVWPLLASDFRMEGY